MYECGSELVGREQERQDLLGLIEQRGPKLALLTGRRRVGKTWLLTHTWPPEQYFLYTAARTSPEINRRQLLTDLAGFTGQSIEADDYPTWRAVFNLLLDLRRDSPLVVVLDEFQYLADTGQKLAEVASELNAAWERAREPQRFLLVLSGSAISTMEGLNAGGAPLYGRFHWQHKLKPLDYVQASQLAPYPDLRDRAATYGVFGGMPRYLAALDTGKSLDWNISNLLLSPRGEVRQLLETALMQEEGLRDIASYNAILRSVATGASIRNDIAQKSGLPNDTALRDKLGNLEELGYLRRKLLIGAKVSAAVRYQLNDAAMRFHYRFVQPNASLLEREPAEAVWQHLKQHLPAHLGMEFEFLVPQAYARLRAARNLPMLAEWGYWEGADRAGQSLEVDVVAPMVERGTLTGSIKWEASPMDVRTHLQHQNMLKRAADAGQTWAHSALEPASPFLYVAASGFTPELTELIGADGRQIITLTLEDLYKA